MWPPACRRKKSLNDPVTRLVFAVASHLHMTAGEVEARMDTHELFCWAGFLFGFGHGVADDAEDMTVEDEIAAWR